MSIAVLARAMLVAQLPAVRRRRYVPLLAGAVDRPFCPDLIYTCPNSLS